MTWGPDEQLLERLREAYAVPPRHYHTLAHAAAVAGRAASLGAERACLLAAWTHDVVYDPTRTDNEAASARWLLQHLPEDPDVQEAARLVRITADHRPPEGDEAAAILCDADLAGLSSAPKHYERYVQAVRREYAHLDDGQWRRGRAQVLRGLLDRKWLFHTVRGRNLWEHAARANLSAELARLEN